MPLERHRPGGPHQATRWPTAQLTITTTEGDIYQTPNAAGATNFVLQSGADLPADYAAETKLSTTFTDGYAQAGLLAYGDDDNYVKLDVISDTGQGRINRVELRSELGGAIQDPQPQVDLPANVTSYRLRLTKQGTSYVGEVAVDGGEWQPVGTVAHPTADLDLGLYALGVQQPGRTASFDYFTAHPGSSREPSARRRRRHRHHHGGPRGQHQRADRRHRPRR